MYIQRFTVEGSGQFPFDMLRYDSCWPATSQDAAHIAGDVLREKRQVTLYTAGKTRNDCHITPDRWASFLWRVVEVIAPQAVGR